MLPSYRNSPVVTKGVSYLWCFVCLMQIAWTMSFAQEQIWLATVFMYFICFGLVAIVYRTNVLFKAETYSSWWLVKAPFTLHLGWIVVATLLSNNVTVVYEGAGAATQLAWCAITLAALTAIGALLAFCGAMYESASDSPILVGVFTWALGAVATELQNPIDAEACKAATGKADVCNMLSEVYSPSITNGLSGACAALSVTMLIVLCALVALAVYRASTQPAEAGKPLMGKKVETGNGAEVNGDEEAPSERAVAVEG
mmetsp:Transcript_15691/g.28207  ORF Transcript_15691/g.28207 Transcript_15691/m.28207 type:complete len:257 (+) Transcript_15691:79-849(+)